MEKIDIDLNSLFNLSYNFENLKLLLTKISKNQDIFETKIKQIENKLNNIDSNPPKEIPKDKTENAFDRNNIRITRDSQKFKTRIETKNSYDDFNRKIFELEDKIRLLYNFIPKFPEDKTRTLNNILDEQQISIDNNNTDIQEMKDKVEKMKGTVDELSIKINDIDIYDIVKDIQFSGGDIEASKILIQSVERKTEARFKFLEEKIKDDEQMSQKLKNDLTNLNNNIILQKNSLAIMSEQIIKMQNEIDSNKRNALERIENNENEIESLKEREAKNLESINNQFQNLTMNVYDLSNNKNEGNNLNVIKEDPKEEKKDEESVTKKSEKNSKKETKDNLSDTEKDKSEERDKMDTSTQKIDDANVISKSTFEEYKKETQKKLNNFERRIQALNSQIKNDYFQKEINALKSELNKKKPTAQEFYDLSVQVQQYMDLYDNMKEENGNMQEEFKKIKDNVSTLLKNYENVILSAASKKMGNNNVEELSGKDRVTILSKFNDFVEITVFNEYIKEQTKFSEKIKKDIDSYRHFYDEIIETLKKAASVQDLKSLEEYLLDLFDEFKEKANKFYPKKSEINKNFKALELQIKQLYEYIIKKDENSENWLLAKKPIGGFSCASCESYLGDLKENNEKVLWNQLPEREILSTNTNRIGNGFSRILNLVNVSKDNNITNRKDNNNNVNVSLRPDYGGLNNELFLQKKSGELEEANNFSENKKYMNITMVKSGDEQKNIFKDFSGNNTKTNFTSKQKISFSQEDKFRLTTSDNMNLLKEMKNKKFKKGLPPINKDDSNVKDINFSSLFEEMKDGKEKQTIPKVMKIVRKKNK